MESGATTAPINIGKTEEKSGNVTVSPNSPVVPSFQAFQGTGYSLKKGASVQGTSPVVSAKKPIVESDESSSDDDDDDKKKKKFSAFSGSGYSLKK
jgi:hypothetical protein